MRHRNLIEAQAPPLKGKICSFIFVAGQSRSFWHAFSSMKALLASLAFFVVTGAVRAADAVRITPLNDRLRIEINGKLFTEYHFTNVTRPYFYPVIGPSDSPMTREWPIGPGRGEEHDHPHHRGMW